jgi:Flp pilus assembly protein TadG
VTRRRRPERGASLVEFGIIALLLFTLLFGIAEFGISYDRYLAVRSGSREGARQGAVGTVGTDASCGINGSATTANANTQRLICLTKARTGLGNSTRVAINATNYVPGGDLVVCVRYRLTSVTGLFGPLLDGRVVRSEIQIRVEEVVSPPIQTTAETEPNGGTFTCTAA